jgi:hypothetical protein
VDLRKLYASVGFDPVTRYAHLASFCRETASMTRRAGSRRSWLGSRRKKRPRRRNLSCFICFVSQLTARNRHPICLSH